MGDRLVTGHFVLSLREVRVVKSVAALAVRCELHTALEMRRFEKRWSLVELKLASIDLILSYLTYGYQRGHAGGAGERVRLSKARE